MYKGPSTDGSLSVCELTVCHIGNFYLFMVHFFHVALFSCCTFSMLHFHHIAQFSSCIFFVLHSFLYCTISCCTFTRCDVFVLHFSAVALLACCNFSLLHFFHVAHLFMFRSSRLQMFFKKGVLKNIAIFTAKHLCWSLFLIKLQALGYFLVNIAKCLTKLFTPLVAASPHVALFPELQPGPPQTSKMVSLQQ